ARSPSTMPPFTRTTYPTGAHRCVIAAAGNKGGRSGRGAASSTLALRVSRLEGSSLNTSWECVCPHRLASSVLCRLGVPFRRRRSGQERTPLVLFFLRHNTSYLCMQVQSIFFRIAPERDEGTIEIHRREGEQAKEGFLVDQGENMRHPRIRAKFGLGQ